MIGWDYKRSGSDVEQWHGAYFSSNGTEKKAKIRKITDNKVTIICCWVQKCLYISES